MQDWRDSPKCPEYEVWAKISVNMKLQGGVTVKCTEVIYVPQAVKNYFECLEDRI